MPYRETHAARQALLTIAARQGGNVTAQQARIAGYDSSYLGAGHLERVGHGLDGLLRDDPGTQPRRCGRVAFGDDGESGCAESTP